MADDSSDAQGGGGQKTYTVKSGDTLSKISQHFYGDPKKYEDIYFANRDKIENPDNLSIGTELVIPDAS
jgi:5'-nucleotidase/UDP-sugar diphosphatase